MKSDNIIKYLLAFKYHALRYSIAVSFNASWEKKKRKTKANNFSLYLSFGYKMLNLVFYSLEICKVKFTDAWEQSDNKLH